MTASKLLFVLNSQGAEMTSDGKTLWVEPSGVLTDEIRDEIRRLKPQLIELLASDTHQEPPQMGIPISDTGKPLPISRGEVQAITVLIERHLSVGPWLMNTPAVRLTMRRLKELTGVKVSSSHLGVFYDLAKAYPDLEPTELLDFFASGLQPAGENPLWRDPAELRAEAEELGRAWSRERVEARRAQKAVAA